MKNRFQEFKPTIFFLLKFVGLYVVCSLLYGWFITAFKPGPDPVTIQVSKHVSWVMSSVGWEMDTHEHAQHPTISLVYEGAYTLSIYEGCNGVNTGIIFVAFVLAFGPLNRTTTWFVPVGLLIIHLMNIIRISLLFLVSQFRPDYMYFFHKYLFTAFLYGVIFLLWIVWVRMNLSRKLN